MSNKLIKSTFIYTCGNAYPKIIGFILIPLYTRLLSPSEYGIINTMAVLSSVVGVFLTLAVNRSVPRLYYDYKEEEKKRFLGTIFIMMAIISTCVLALFFIFHSPMGNIFKSTRFYPLIAFTLLIAYFTTYSYLPMTYLRLKEKAANFVSLSISKFTLEAIIKIIILTFFIRSAYGMILGSLITEIIFFPIFLIIISKIIVLKFSPDICKESLKFSLPYIPSVLSAWILNLSDRIFLERYFSLSDVGIYSMGYQFAGYILLLTEAFNRAYEPIYYSLANSGQSMDKIRGTLSKYNYKYLTTIIFLSFLISLFSKEVVTILLDQRYREAYKISMLISFAYCISQSCYIFEISIVQKKKPILLMWIILITAIVNIVLNFVLIPKFRIYGAASSTIISFSLLLALDFYFAKKLFYIPMNFLKPLGQVILLIGVVVTSVLIFKDTNIYFSLTIKIVIAVIVALFLYKDLLITKLNKN